MITSTVSHIPRTSRSLEQCLGEELSSVLGFHHILSRGHRTAGCSPHHLRIPGSPQSLTPRWYESMVPLLVDMARYVRFKIRQMQSPRIKPATELPGSLISNMVTIFRVYPFGPKFPNLDAQLLQVYLALWLTVDIFDYPIFRRLRDANTWITLLSHLFGIIKT